MGTVSKITAGGATHLLASTCYGTCDTAAATAAKVATIQDSQEFTLLTGTTVHIKFTYSNTVASPTLNVNSTGAKSIMRYGTTAPSTNVNTSWNAGSVLSFTYDGTYWQMNDFGLRGNDNTVPAVYCSTAAATAAKGGSCSGYVLTAHNRFHITFTVANTVQGAITLNINSTGAKPLYINGAASSASNYTLPAGTYFGYYDGTNYHVRTDGNIPGYVKGTDVATSDTTYSAGSGLTLSTGNKFDHSSSITAGTVGTSSATSGSTLAVPYVTYNATGHITGTGTHTHTVSGFLTSHQTIKQDAITGATVNRYAACSTAAATAAKAASITTGTFSLETGARVTVKFTYANSADTPTLNISSSGAKNIFHKGAQITTGTNKTLLAGVCDFVYDGTQWHLVGNYIDTNTNTTYSAGTGLSLSSTTFNHSNSVTAQTTQAVYPITIDGTGHISGYGSAVTSMTPSSHTHGNIQNGGTLQTNDITIGDGDKLVVTDSSDSNKVARTSLSFGTSTTTFLNNSGAWSTPVATSTYTTCTLPMFTAAGSTAVTVSGVTASSNPVLDVYIDTSSNVSAYVEAWSHIYRADTSANTITFYSDAATSTALTIMVKGY